VPRIRFPKGEAIRALQKIEHSFYRSGFLSHQAHVLHPRREWANLDDLRLQVPIGSPTLISLDLPLTALVGDAGRRRQEILTYTQIRYNKSEA
jgi:hypothetical protein